MTKTCGSRGPVHTATEANGFGGRGGMPLVFGEDAPGHDPVIPACCAAKPKSPMATLL